MASNGTRRCIRCRPAADHLDVMHLTEGAGSRNLDVDKALVLNEYGSVWPGTPGTVWRPVPPRITYQTRQYPAPSRNLIRREIAELESLGVAAGRFSTHELCWCPLPSVCETLTLLAPVPGPNAFPGSDLDRTACTLRDIFCSMPIIAGASLTEPPTEGCRSPPGGARSDSRSRRRPVKGGQASRCRRRRCARPRGSPDRLLDSSTRRSGTPSNRRAAQLGSRLHHAVGVTTATRSSCSRSRRRIARLRGRVSNHVDMVTGASTAVGAATSLALENRGRTEVVTTHNLARGEPLRAVSKRKGPPAWSPPWSPASRPPPWVPVSAT